MTDENFIDDAMKKVDESLTKARNIGWNQAVDEAISVIINIDWETPPPKQLIEKLKALKK